MKCRSCDTEIEIPFLSLGNSPLANSFIKEEDLYKKEEYYPLDVYVCPICKLVQAMDYVSSDVIFNSNYSYFSSFSKTWVEHCKNYVDMIVERLNLNKNSRILEIGSNDGTLLENFKKYKINNVIGVDPAKDCANEASKKGINTHKFMFNEHYVKDMIGNHVIDLVIGNNVLAHNPNLNEFVQSIKYILKLDGIVTLEFPHLLNLIKYNQFDTIYHEHFSYFSLLSIIELLKQHNLHIIDLEEITTHGGSLRIYIKHNDEDTEKMMMPNSVRDVLNKELEFGLNNISNYHEFADKVTKTKKNILKFMIKLSEYDKKIVAYGAPAKGNTLLNYCGIGKDFIDYTVDISPYKQKKYLPGTHLPIYSLDKIKEDKPDYIIILPWNIKEEIIKQLEHTKKWNCKLVTLIPNISIKN